MPCFTYDIYVARFHFQPKDQDEWRIKGGWLQKCNDHLRTGDIWLLFNLGFNNEMSVDIKNEYSMNDILK